CARRVIPYCFDYW
nr:immunoglobulin heavy chain junction region [Macaca mulatta]